MPDTLKIIPRINKIGIIGEGKMGTSIFNYLLDYRFDLVWVCSAEADPGEITRQLAKKIKRMLVAGIIDQARFEQLQQIAISQEIKTLHDCDLIIEAIPENTELKKMLFSRLDEMIKPETIFTSNSSSINPGEMAPPGNRSNRFAGLHFFYPLLLKNIVELTLMPETSEQTATVLESFLQEINRRYITLSGHNSFMLNKIFLDFQNEAFLLVSSGRCSMDQMDQLVRDHFFPFGVFDFCDSVGLDTMLTSILNYTRDYPHKSYYAPLIEKISGLVSQGRMGSKTQAGFYNYPREEKTKNAPEGEADIIEYLQQSWLSSCKRFTAQAHIPIEDANHAIREYFDLPKGPFEMDV